MTDDAHAAEHEVDALIHITFTHPDDDHASEVELALEDEPFTVGRDESCTVTMIPKHVSRFALIIAERAGGRVSITGGQSNGYVQVTRDDRVAKATLSNGEEIVCVAGTYTVSLRPTTGSRLDLEITATGRNRLIEPGAVTTGMWSQRQVLDPTPEDDWRWFAALTTVLWHSSSRHYTRDLELLAKAWHGGDWHGNVQGKLDKVLEKLVHRQPGLSKVEAIATEVLSSGVVQPEDYEAFRDQVKQRALTSLSRGQRGALGWGYLDRETRR